MNGALGIAEEKISKWHTNRNYSEWRRGNKSTRNSRTASGIQLLLLLLSHQVVSASDPMTVCGISQQEYWNGGCHFLLQGIFWHRDWTWISCIGRQILFHWATREALFRRHKLLLKLNLKTGNNSIKKRREQRFEHRIHQYIQIPCKHMKRSLENENWNYSEIPPYTYQKV